MTAALSSAAARTVSYIILALAGAVSRPLCPLFRSSMNGTWRINAYSVERDLNCAILHITFDVQQYEIAEEWSDLLQEV